LKKTLKRTVLIILTLVMLLQVPITAEAATSFPDVNSDDWFYADVTKLASMGVINGQPDGTFKPDYDLTRGEFIKMLVMVADIWTIDTSTKKHWAEYEWIVLNDNGLLEISTAYDGKNSAGTLFPCTAKALDTPITRNEMAFLINAVLYMSFFENQMALSDSNDSFANHILDYGTMDPSYRSVVEQCYAKGILTGDGDTIFSGYKNLTRAEGAKVIARLLWSSERKTINWAVQKEYEIDPTFKSFAFQYRTMSNSERRQMLFGNASKTYFTSPTNAKAYMVAVSVPIWKLNESTGKKYSSTASLTVNKRVEKEVKAIFNYIYNSPEKFPIKAIGGARYSDTMRHSWGCAIDINPTENYYINYKSGQTVPSSGGFCYKNGSSPYCITPNSSVVKAFAMYGWGWGGQGWSTAADYMHFSILASGG